MKTTSSAKSRWKSALAMFPLSVTMRTPGHDLELATGFLFTEGLISDRNQIASVRHEPGVLPSGATESGANRVRVDLAPGVDLDPEAPPAQLLRHLQLWSLRQGFHRCRAGARIAPPNPDCTVDPEVLCRLPDQLRAGAAVFSRTGALHAAGLFTLSGELQVLREDVGRHNAVDKVVGWALANDRVPLCAIHC